MKYVTPYKYASLCGVKPQAIYQRIAKGTLEKVQIPSADGTMKDYIDVDKFPPARLREENKK